MQVDPNKVAFAAAAVVGAFLGIGQFLGHEKIVEAAVMNPMLSGFGFGVAAVCGTIFVYLQWGGTIKRWLSRPAKPSAETSKETKTSAAKDLAIGCLFVAGLGVIGVVTFPLFLAVMKVATTLSMELWTWLLGGHPLDR